MFYFYWTVDGNYGEFVQVGTLAPTEVEARAILANKYADDREDSASERRKNFEIRLVAETNKPGVIHAGQVHEVSFSH